MNNESLLESIREKVKDFPQSPGVYLMKNKMDRIIYVGKAINLRSRVKSYFLDSKDLSPKTRLLVSHIVSVEYILTKSEVEAFLLEASFIKKHKPKYNIRLKDDKTYPYIRFSMKDKFPRIYLARRVKKDGAHYFGPFTNSKAVFQTIQFLNQTFKIRDCSDHFFKNRTRPCITYQIGYCKAPCVGYISEEDYRNDIKSAISFLQGKNKKILNSLKEEMYEASEEEKFEKAAKLRDRIALIESLFEKQSVVSDEEEKDQDIINFFGDERGVSIEVLSLRHGRVLGSRSQFLSQLNIHSEEEASREWLINFINLYYEDNYIPDEIIVPVELDQETSKILQRALKLRSEREIQVLYASTDKQNRLIEMSLENAKEHFKNHIEGSESKLSGLYEIQKKLKLPHLPQRIECYDISHFQGAETVASQVVFDNGVPNTDQYRKYKLQSVQGVDDYESMKEVLTRRLQHDEWDDPQLILIDGGKGQLNIAAGVLKELNRTDIPVASLAKARTRSGFTDKKVESTKERFFIPGRSNEILFKENSEAFKILVGIRDEAHRFAITYHRKLREKSSLESVLDHIPGIGEKRKKALLTHYKDIDAIKNSNIEDIANLEGFNQKLAETILSHLQEVDEIAEQDEEDNAQRHEGVETDK